MNTETNTSNASASAVVESAKIPFTVTSTETVFPITLSAKKKGPAPKKGEEDKREVLRPQRPAEITIQHPAFAELAAEQQATLYQNILSGLARVLGRDNNEAEIQNADGSVSLKFPFDRDEKGAFSEKQSKLALTVSVTYADLIESTKEGISEELENAYRAAFVSFIAASGKSAGAQKLGERMLKMGAAALELTEEKTVDRFAVNVDAFRDSLDADKLEEFAPLFARTAGYLAKSKERRNASSDF